jgi:repressor LexA
MEYSKYRGVVMFWENFTDLCVRNNKTASVVCRELGLSNAASTKWKNGAIPHDTTIKKIADYFDVPPVYFKNTGMRENKYAVPKTSRGIWVPVLGRVAAGLPLEAVEEIVDYEEITPKMANEGECFGLVIHGHSMEPRMTEGDVVIVRKQEDADNGDIVIALINGTDAVCKKLKKTTSGITLISTNPVYDPMHFSNSEVLDLPVHIIGKVIELRAKY